MEKQGRTGHAVLIPCPTFGHINPLLKLARVLHSRGFHITFFITEQVRDLQLAAAAPPDEPHSCSLRPLEGFHIEVVSDGLPPSCSAGQQYLRDLTVALRTTFIDEVRRRLSELQPEVPPVTSVIAGLVAPALQLAGELRVPGFLFWTTSACGFLPVLHTEELIARGYVTPHGGGSCTTGTAHLDRVVDWIPGMRPLRVRDMSNNYTIIEQDEANDVFLELDKEAAVWASRASGGMIFNTFNGLEHEALQGMRPKFKSLYAIGPLSAVLDSIEGGVPSIEISLWRDERRYLSWLDKQDAGSVLYVNFGSIATMDPRQLRELVLGVVNSGVPFLWIARPGLINSKDTNENDPIPNKIIESIPDELMESVNMRGFFAEWCAQEEVLAHPAVGGFLTHAGWNSMSESIHRGVPMLCKPFIYDQPINCRYACDEWGVAMELEDKVSACEVESLVRELMCGSKGKVLRDNMDRWRKTVSEQAMKGGPSFRDMEALIEACNSTKH